MAYYSKQRDVSKYPNTKQGTDWTFIVVAKFWYVWAGEMRGAKVH